MEIDINPNNPHKRNASHTIDVLFRGETDPHEVANRRYWECKLLKRRR